MRSNLMKVSALVFGAIIAISATASAAIPAGPWPQGAGKSGLSAIPAGPWPQGAGKGKLA